jgi:periplasmic protein CpxP/Spy
MLKNWLLVLMLAWLICALTPFVAAQDGGSGDQSSGPSVAAPQSRPQMDPAALTQILTKRLNLTPEQQTKVLDILKSEQSQIETLRSDSSLTDQDRRSKMMEIHKTANDQIRALLTPEQQKQFDEMESGRAHRGRYPNGQVPSASNSSDSTQP